MPATFVIDADGDLRLADRHAEHVACSGGEPVRSAGKMFFVRGANGWEVADVSNQSTRFCPDLESWLQVAAALARIPLPHPDGCTLVHLFRRCLASGQLNIVKDDIFECRAYGADLPSQWNLDVGAVR